MSEGRLIKNKLRIVRQVGRGGMGYVYEVFHEGLRVTRALKQIVGDLQDNPEIERRFLHEAQMMARLEHPHIVRVFDIDAEPDFGTYLLMEFIRGRDLGDLLRQEGRFSYSETLRIGIAVASALDCAHRAGLVHRDIKPANILIEDGTGRPVVTDFGIAKEVESAGDESFTRTGSFVGTYRYSSREQIRSEKGVPIDGRADVYSLGVVLYEIYAGRKYLAGMPELKIASCVGYQDDWVPVLDYPEPPPPLFEKLILECLAPDREQRVKTANELVRRLEECRRLESIDVSSGAGDVAGEAALAASSATTRTAPTPSEAGVTQGAAALGEMTATTRDEPERPQTATETRSQWVALLQGLRGAVDDQAGEFERLLKELIALDIPRDDFRQLDDMSQILHRVERAESQGQYQDAASNLQGLSDRIQRLNTEIERTIASAIADRATELTSAWRELAANAGELVAAERTAAFEQALAPVEGLLAANDWEAAREALREARARLEQSRTDARTVASERSGTALRELRTAFAALRARSADAASASGIDPDAVQADVAARLERDALASALQAGAAALAAVRDAVAALDREERERADAARSEAERARAALDRDEARELAGDELAAAEAAEAAAANLAAGGDARGAAQGYAEAARLYGVARERVANLAAEQIAAAADALRELVEPAAKAPIEVVGDALRAAQRLLAGERPRERRAALAALDGARAVLSGSLEQVAPFEQARDAERRALAAREGAVTLGASTADLAAADRLLDEARAALGRRAFAEAHDRLTAAIDAFQEVGREVVARGEGERLAAARAQIDDALTSLDTTLAGELCAAEIERALRARSAADAAERSGDRAAALAASGEAIGALHDAAEALFAGLTERVEALAAEARSLTARAGDLLGERSRAEAERGVSAARQALERRDAREIAAELDRTWRLLGDLRVDLDARTRAAAGEGLASIRALLESAPAAASALRIDPDALGSTVDSLVGEERFAEARRTIDDALAELRRAVDAERDREAAALAEAKRTAESARRSLDRDAARRLAASELQQADDAFAAAERAERDGDRVAGAGLYVAAAEAASAVRAALRERQIAEFEAERAQLEQALAAAAGAAEEVAGRARAEARVLLEATVAGDLAQATDAIRAARAVLEQAVAEAQQYAAARERQQLARAAEKRLGALGASRRQLKSAASLLREADASFARRAWAAADTAYAGAERALSEVEADLQSALDKEKAAARAKEEAAARAAAEKAARARAAEEARARERERREQEAAKAKARAREEAEAREAALAEERARAAAEQQARAAREEGERAAAATRARSAESADATVIPDAADATLIAPAADATRLGGVVPEAQPRKGIPLAWLGGGAAALAAAAGLALWLSQREASEPIPQPKTAKVDTPAKQVPAPPKRAPAPPSKEEPLASSEEPAVAEPKADEPAQVANVPRPSPVAPPPLRISGFTPDDARVAVKEDARQAFSIDVTGGPEDARPKIAWRLDDEIVARDVSRWEYAPGFDAASDAPRTLEVVVGDGAEAQTKSWQVDVANVNRKPKLTTTPRSGGKLEAKLGDTVKLRADVKDDDGDKIAYAWTIDGKPAGDQPQLDVPVTGDRSVSLTATDGDAEVSASWQIAAIKPVLKLDTTPARLERLRFEKPQDFALSPPPGATGLEAEWTVDGKKVASGSRFTFANDDPALVRRTPVKVAVSARSADGRTFERSWDFVVEPPTPEVTQATPPPGKLEAESGSTQTFEIAARGPIGGQSLAYVFQVDGKQAARGSSPRFQYRVADDKPHRIVGYVQDNFDQVSRRSEWSIAPSSGIVNRARSWLDEYQAAFNAKDAQRIGRLRGLSADMVAELQKVLDDQTGLRVTFSNVQIDKLDDQRARLTYTRTDDFTDVRGAPVSRTGTVEQVVGVVNGRLTELETRRR